MNHATDKNPLQPVLSHWMWWRMTGSNRRPPACKAGALPAELIPHSTSNELVGLVGFEPTTPALSRRCSNRLSYRPTHSSMHKPSVHRSTQPRRMRHWPSRRSPGLHTSSVIHCCVWQPIRVGARNQGHFRRPSACISSGSSRHPIPYPHLQSFSRKEVIQPHLPIRLPCYDFTPVTNPAVVIALLAVRLTTSGRTRSHGVTGGVYKTRERIHRGKLIRDY